MINNRNLYDRTRHAAARTDDYLFNQLIPYIGNKRKLLGLIQEALARADTCGGDVFLDLFAGSGVVSRLAKRLGYEVVSNDWEPYSAAINNCYIGCNTPPSFEKLGGYQAAIETLNDLPPVAGWITNHLCPQDDENCDPNQERMFYMRKNGMRIDAIRAQIQLWKNEARISPVEESCLLAPLLYQTCYTSNTSGVFKAYHNGWGGQTATALYRIAGDLKLSPAVLLDNGMNNEVHCREAQALAENLSDRTMDIVYLDPPYNQHPYASNYHVLNTVTLWDSPALSRRIKRGNKSAIRRGWRTARRSAYNYQQRASNAYAKLIATLNARYVLTSYSTDGFIPLRDMLRANIERGHLAMVMQSYKRYRVSSQRFSNKPMNVEFILVLDTRRKSDINVEEAVSLIESAEKNALQRHPEHCRKNDAQLALF